MLGKAATIKRFEYLSLGRELKARADIAKKQYQKLDNTFEFDQVIKKTNKHLKNIVNQI